MAGPGDIREVVDRLLAANKQPAGLTDWKAQDNDCRLVSPLLVSGEISDATLTVISFPRSPELRFRIVLSYLRAIWRLDYTLDETHVNPAKRPDDIAEYTIQGPHFHSWKDNRHLATNNSLPRKLLVARILPPNVRTFPNAFRWFCGETHIDLGPSGVPDLPKSDRLL